MEYTEKLGCLGRHSHHSHLHGVVSIGLPPDGAHRGHEPPWMESSEKLGYLTLISTAAIYMLQFPLGYLQMNSTEEFGHPGWKQD
jgi:hypothetical protein